MKWAAPGAGYIIQHVRVVNGRKNCFTGKPLKLEGWDDPEYWECWQVGGGKVKYPGGAQPKWDDCFEIPDQGRTKGRAEIIGEVKFFPNYRLSKVWKKNEIPEAGILPTSTAAPPGWDATGALSHTLESNWVCCPGEESGSVTGTPQGPLGDLRSTSPPVTRVLRTISEMPKWSEAAAGDRAARAAIEADAAAIGGAGLKTIRAAIRLYLKWVEAKAGGPEIGDLSRIFVLNRYLFDVPSRAAAGEIRIFGGWHGVRAGGDTIRPLWPWQVARGRKRLVGSYQGYSGPSYLALAEFDYFRRTLPGVRVSE